MAASGTANPPAVAASHSTARAASTPNSTQASGGATTTTKSSRRKSCEHPSCPKQPAFSFNGSTVRFCAQHRLEGMVNVRNRRCEGEGCTKEPYFGEVGGKARFCATHKPDENMVDVRHRQCEFEPCKKQPNYGYEGQRACYCSEHKLPTMVDVKHRRCAATGCRGYSSFSFPGSKEKFCVEHRSEGMVMSGRNRQNTGTSNTAANNASNSNNINNNNNARHPHTTAVATAAAPGARGLERSASTITVTTKAPASAARRRSGSSTTAESDYPNVHGHGGGSEVSPVNSRARADASGDDEGVQGGYARRGTKNPAHGEVEEEESTRRRHKRRGSTGSSQDDEPAAVGVGADVTGMAVGDEDVGRSGGGCGGGGDCEGANRGADDPWWIHRRSCPADFGAAFFAAATLQKQQQQHNQSHVPMNYQHPHQQQQQQVLPSLSSSSGFGNGSMLRPTTAPAATSAATAAAGFSPTFGGDVATADPDAPDELSRHTMPRPNFRAPRPVKSLSWGALPCETMCDSICGGGRVCRGSGGGGDGDRFGRGVVGVGGGGGVGCYSDGGGDVSFRQRGDGAPASLLDIPSNQSGGRTSSCASSSPSSSTSPISTTKFVRHGGPVGPCGVSGSPVGLGVSRSGSSLSPDWRGSLPVPASLMGSRWPSFFSRRGGIADGAGDGSGGGGRGTGWGFSIGRTARELGPSPPVVRGSGRIDGMGNKGLRGGGRNKWFTASSTPAAGVIGSAAAAAAARSDGPCGDHNTPAELSSTAWEDAPRNSSASSVVTLYGPKIRHVKYERGLGSLGPTLETLEPAWRVAGAVQAVVAPLASPDDPARSGR